MSNPRLVGEQVARMSAATCGRVQREVTPDVASLIRATLSILHDGQIAHVSHAKIARRVNLSHAPGIAEDPKSAPSSARPASIRGALAIVTNVGRDAVDALAFARRAKLKADGKAVWS